jgi:hypothetical protein
MKTTKVVIREPIWFSDADEDSFFDWLKSLKAVKDFVGVPSGLEITLSDPVDEFSLRELLGLMSRYDLDMKWLRALRTSENESWFADDQKYWHDKVFGD